MLWQSTLVASLLAIGAQAGIGDLIVEGLMRNKPAVERRLEDLAKANLRSTGYLERRQSQGSESDAPLKPDGSLDMGAWNLAADEACRDVLADLPLASNPSGACVCYNLPILNNSTGTFEADLRLYRLSEPTGDFEGIPPDEIEVELSYNGASVSEVNQPVTKRATPLAARQNSNMTDLRLLQSYLFVGQIDKNRMSGQITMGQLQALVTPIVTLKATNGNGQAVSTNVSSNEASFVAGHFSKDVFMSDVRLAELAVEAEVARLKNGTTAFVLPGVQLMIFPVGLVITSIWLLAGLAAYGTGTYARYQFREAHRRRIAIAEKQGLPRI